LIPVRATVSRQNSVQLNAPRAIFNDDDPATVRLTSGSPLGTPSFLIGVATRPIEFEGCSSFGTQIVCEVPRGSDTVRLSPRFPKGWKFETDIRWRVISSGTAVITNGSKRTLVRAEKEYELVLFPARPLRGASSAFHVEKFFSSDRADRTRIRPPIGICMITCPAILDFIPREFSSSSEFTHPSIPGTLIEVHHEDLARMIFQLRAFAVSSTRRASETTIPVVREQDMRQERLALSIMADPTDRVTVRVFDPDANANARFLIRFRDEKYLEHEFLATTTVIPPPGEIRAPGFIQHSFGSVRPLFIEVVALDSHQRFWAYATKTDNVTNHITAVSPD
jgi:hypothetical protein